jgi:hypothetical protein
MAYLVAWHSWPMCDIGVLHFVLIRWNGLLGSRNILFIYFTIFFLLVGWMDVRLMLRLSSFIRPSGLLRT